MTYLILIIGLLVAAPQCSISRLIGARERLAKQDARARTRSSSGAFAGECAEQLIESRERCTAARRCGCRAETARLLFFCRRFLFQIKRKCRNAGSIYRLIMVCSEGRNQLATIQPYYNFISASPISDSRKGCPYEVRGLKFVRILKGERSSPPTVCKTGFSEDFVPLTRQRCVESPHPTSYISIKLCGFRDKSLFVKPIKRSRHF